MKKKYFLIAAAFTCFIGNANAQSPNWLWANAVGDIYEDSGNSIAVDASGNVYTAGTFQGTADFDPGVGVFNLTSLGSNDIFNSKLDSSGNFVWAKRMGGITDDRGLSIAIDASGNVYTTGFLSWNTFISKLDSSGNFVWTKTIMNVTGNSVDGYSIAIDTAESGDVYTTGTFGGTADFDPGAGVFYLTAAPGTNDIFISKLDSSGNFVWAKVMGGGANNDEANSIAIDPAGSGDVYTTGTFQGTVDFDPGAGVFNLTGGGGFISKLDSSGNFIWAKAIGGEGFSIAIDPSGSGDVYTAGNFYGTDDFDPGAGIFNLTAGYWDIFISKLDSSGNFIWAKQMGGTGYDWGFSIAIEPAGSGDVYTTGRFQGTADFDPGAGVFNLTSAGNYDIFISKLDSSGNFVWAKAVGGIYEDGGYSIAADASDNVHVAGYFESPSITLGSTTLTNAGGYDIFIAKLDTVLITGNNEIGNFGKGVLVFPNPATNHLTIALVSTDNKVEVAINDITGKIIYTTTARETQKIEVNTRDFAEGIYVVRIQSANFIETKKLIIAK